ncbi:PspC domain-containing protein [Kitasatospora sp. LaBMicrA B282]|uniref:PspC domain-containing protein n=1 Tax=Kitasatospora sp. LaBMicrA B282 TaxID=3420949 RepID=UPI003D136B06
MTEEQSAAEDQRAADEQSRWEDDPQQEAGGGRPPLVRDETHRVVAGVCGGLGRHLDIDPVVFRVVTAVLCLTGGLGLFLYGLAWLIVPTEHPDGKHGRTELQRVLTGRVDGQSIGAVLLTVIGTGVFFSWMGSGDSVFPLLLLGAMVFFAVRYDPERRRRARGLGRPARPGGPFDRPTGPGLGLGFGGRSTGTEGGSASPLSDWKTWRRDFHEEWASRKADFHEEWATRKAELREEWAEQKDRMREEWADHAAAGKVDLGKHQRGATAGEAPADSPADAPRPGRTGYLWDPRHPERNPYGTGPGTPPDAPTQAWWQRTDLPAGDPLRKAGPVPTRPAAPVRRERRPRSVLAPFGLLLSVGVAWLVWSLNGALAGTVLLSVTLATGLLCLGLTIMLGAKFGRARALAVPALLVTLVLAAVGSTAGSAGLGLGDRSWTPQSAGAVNPQYQAGLGNARLDLTAVDPAGGTVTTRLRLAAGDAFVVLPPDVAVDLDLHTVAGDVLMPGQDRHGNVGEHLIEHLDPVGGTPAKGTIDLTVQVGLGEIHVERQG